MLRLSRPVSLLLISATVTTFTVPAWPVDAGNEPRLVSEGSRIEVWVRASGPAKGIPLGDEPPRARTLTLDLDRLPHADVNRVDAQYGGGSHAFRGLTLKSLIAQAAPEPFLDLAILHFANGMAIPLPFRDDAVMKRLDPFLARGMESGPSGPIKLDAFPPIVKTPSAKAALESRSKMGALVGDVRPLTFAGNKVVVAEAWHPALGPSATGTFSPWSHADSLVSIELVAAEPYYHQFDVSNDATVREGLQLYQQTCQFCHGARKVGAKFGWDFVEPTPMYAYHKPVRNFFLHVAYKPLDAAERGLMMPAMHFMTEAEAKQLWQWLRAVANKTMPPYVLPTATVTAPAPAAPPLP